MLMVMYCHQWSFQPETAVNCMYRFCKIVETCSSNEPMLQLDLLLRQNTLKLFGARGKTTKYFPQRKFALNFKGLSVCL